MRFGIELAGAAATADPRVLGELAHIAEASGWDGIFLEDYIVHHSAAGIPTCDPWVVLAVMAMRTDRVRLGTEVTALPRRRPWKLAREVATLNHLSEGRIVLGAGLGDVNDPGFAAVGEPTDARTRSSSMRRSRSSTASGQRSHSPLRVATTTSRSSPFTPRPFSSRGFPSGLAGAGPTRALGAVQPGGTVSAPTWIPAASTSGKTKPPSTSRK